MYYFGNFFLICKIHIYSILMTTYYFKDLTYTLIFSYVMAHYIALYHSFLLVYT